jgi:lipopolysaccharide/colanic/teichoic acid biosynthesis glycosyltransferase
VIRVHSENRFPEGIPSPDVYFLPEYGRAAALADPGEWLLLEAYDGAWQMPLIVRTLVDGTKDATSPYGYSGVYASGSLTPPQIHEAWGATVTCLRELGVISMELRHSPLVPQASDLTGLRSIISGHPTIVLEPTDGDSAWSDLQKHCRNRIRKALKNGYTGAVRPAEGRDLASGGDFRRLYEQTMHRLDAALVYFFSDEYYKELLDGLGSNLLISEVRDPKGAVTASLLLMRHEQRLHSHLQGSNRDDAPMGSNNLLYWTASQFALDQGIRHFHLGGGVDARDSLFRFKHTFGGRELVYGVSGTGRRRRNVSSPHREAGQGVQDHHRHALGVELLSGVRGGTRVKRATDDRTKRVFDVTIATLLLILTLPIQLVTAMAIRIRLGSPVLFRHTRPGLHGELFDVVKFRTMSNVDPARGLIDDASRMTPLGHWLRATSLDELPTLWNVIRGDMSLVGPRPLVIDYLGRYTPEQARRHDVRPGITGLAQISGRNALRWEDKFRLDVHYVDHHTFGGDLKILVGTVGSVARRDGISEAGETTSSEFLGTDDYEERP